MKENIDIINYPVLFFEDYQVGIEIIGYKDLNHILLDPDILCYNYYENSRIFDINKKVYKLQFDKVNHLKLDHNFNVDTLYLKQKITNYLIAYNFSNTCFEILKSDNFEEIIKYYNELLRWK
jgi:hypothetical protein